MTDYSYAALGDLMKQMIDNAIQSFLFENEWGGTVERGFTGTGWDHDLPSLGASMGGGTLRLKSNMMTQTYVAPPPPGSRYLGEETEGTMYFHVYEVDPWTDIYEPIIDRINNAFRGWRSLPDPADFRGVKDVLADAVDALTPAEQSDGSYTFVDVGVTSALELMRTWVSPQGQQASSDLLFAFDSAYGVGRIAGVLTNQGQVAAALGLAVAAEEQVWTKARADIMTIATDAAEVLRYDSGGGFSLDLGVVKAFVDLVAVFTPASIGTLMSGLSAGIGFLDEVTPEPTTESRKLTVEGADVPSQLTSLETAIKDLEEAIFAEEQEIAKKMRRLGEILAERPADDFHIHAGAGMDQPFVDAAEIRIDVAMVRTIGTRDVPTIAGAFLDAADLASGQTGSGIWSRDEMIGYGTVGAHTPWSMRMADFDAITTGSAKELIEAGKMLAIAAGLVGDADVSAHEAVQDHQDELERGKIEWSA